MKVFQYRAVGADGSRVRGVLTAEHQLDLLAQLGQNGLMLVRARDLSAWRWRLRIAPNVRARELASYFAALRQIVQTRTPLLRGLNAVANGSPNRTLREVGLDIASQVARGRTLSVALGTYPHVFDPVFVALLAAGEQAGRLDVALAQCEAHAQWLDDTARKLAASLSYPLFLAGLSVAVLVFMVTWLAPKVLVFLGSMREAPGAATRSLLWLATQATLHGREVGLAILALAACFVVLVATSSGVRRLCHALLLRVPVLGVLLRRADAHRYAHFAGVGIASGLSTQRALQVATTVVRNEILRAQLRAGLDRLARGEELSLVLARTGLFTPLMLEAVASSGLTDHLGAAFERIARLAATEAQELGSRVAGIIPAAITLLVGAVLAWILLALFLPIYSALPTEMLFR